MNEHRPVFRVKIIPPRGTAVYRLHFSRRHVAAAAAALVVAVCIAVGYHAYRLRAAEGNVRDLQALTTRQQTQLQEIDRQADALTNQLRSLQRENAEIKHIVGGKTRSTATRPASSPVSVHDSGFDAVKARLKTLATVSSAASSDQRFLRRLAYRVLNVRRMAAIARSRMLAAVPSLNPVNGGIAAAYGWRTNPWPEFHKGVDLEANWGTPVHATAAGTVASAGWDGGFGIKIDIDHGNGYHTWYAHLSRVMVRPGERVTKGMPIALSGATGEATGPHLHYQVMREGQAIDPAPYLSGIPSSVLATLPSSPGV